MRQHYETLDILENLTGRTSGSGKRSNTVATPAAALAKFFRISTASAALRIPVVGEGDIDEEDDHAVGGMLESVICEISSVQLLPFKEKLRYTQRCSAAPQGPQS